MSGSPRHEHHMRRAIELARRVPQLPFGAVIVRQGTGRVVAEGWNRSAENPTWHGEIDAINRCALSHPDIDWTRVVFGTSIRFLQGRGWRQIDILAEEVVRRKPFQECVLVGGVLEEECNALFEHPPWSHPGEGR